MSGPRSERVPIEPQSIDAPLSRSAVFLIVTVPEPDDALNNVRRVISDIGALVRAVGFRDLGGHLSCNVGIGGALWDRLDEDAEFAGGSYVVVQKYLHDLDAWGRQTTENQEHIVGRTKDDNVEIFDAPDGHKSHRHLTGIVDGQEAGAAILRDNMPFGRPGQSEFGTYFIGYTANLSIIDKMIANMFIGDPEGEYDRILDFSKAQTGTTFFLPSNEHLTGM